MLCRNSDTRDESAVGAISAITVVSAWRSSSADWKRLSRSAASACSATWSSAGVIQGARVEGATSCGWRTSASAAAGSSPDSCRNCCPVSSSHSTMPSV